MNYYLMPKWYFFTLLAGFSWLGFLVRWGTMMIIGRRNARRNAKAMGKTNSEQVRDISADPTAQGWSAREAIDGACESSPAVRAVSAQVRGSVALGRLCVG